MTTELNYQKASTSSKEAEHRCDSEDAFNRNLKRTSTSPLAHRSNLPSPAAAKACLEDGGLNDGETLCYENTEWLGT